MKVAYSTQLGLFELNHLATMELAKRKGLTLTAYTYSFEKGIYNKEPDTCDPDLSDCVYLTKDMGDKIHAYRSVLAHEFDFDSNESRCDKDLIAIIELLGEKANTHFSDLQIKEIPDGARFEITNDEGVEDVVRPRPTW